MARKWEAIICFEDRSVVHTSRWRLSGVKTKEDAENTDGGVLWLELSKSGDTVTANLYKDDGLAAENKVLTGTVDVSGVDGTGANAAECALTDPGSGGLSGSFWIHDYQSDPAGGIPVQVALCVDEDADGLWDGIEDLPGYHATNGLAEHIRMASHDVLGKVMAIYQDQLGGYAAAEAWFITDAQRSFPDLRCIANPGQLRVACAYHALEMACGSAHQRAGETMYSENRDYFRGLYERAMSTLVMAFKSGSGDDAADSASAQTVRMERA